MSRLFLIAVLTCSPLAGAVTFEAEEASVRSVGNRIWGGWNLHSHGTVAECFHVRAQGAYGVTVRAYGSPLGGVWPTMALAVDGVVATKTTVDKTAFTDYAFRTELTPGVHLIGVAFLNDACDDAEDRNLYLDNIEIRPPEGGEEPVAASMEEWGAQAKKRVAKVLAGTSDAIAKHRMSEATVTVVDGDGKPMPGVRVTVEQTRHDFLFGCNIYMFDRCSTGAENEAYKTRFEELFNYATAGFYWVAFEPEQGEPQYPYMDSVVEWCGERGIRVKGHPLLWAHKAGIPSWSDGQPAHEVQRRRVTEIIQRYEGRIASWEVVNEPAHLSGIRIDEPYRWARDASSGACLIVNDYAVLADGYPPFLDMLEEAKRKGVPFDGIGIQAHEPADMAFPLDRVQTILDTYAVLGEGLHITEFSPCSNGLEVLGSPWMGTWDEATQAAYAEQFYRVCFAHPAVVAITWWDFSDQGSWREHGGMLRADMTPKPVYETMKRLIHEEWRTSLQGETGEDGRFTFSGFHGQYHIGTPTRQASFHLTKNAPNTVEFRD